MNILDEITENKKEELKVKKIPLREIEREIPKMSKPKDFKKAISIPGRVALIGEIKKASPSAGLLVKDFDVKKIAENYQRSGINAISVLTEKKYFRGDLSHVRMVKENTDLPVLRKDFIVDTYQLYESRYIGADAVLLISEILSEKEIEDMLCVARSFGMSCVAEAHDAKNMEKVLKTSADVIGINNRDLKNFKVDLNTTLALKKMIPEDKIVISESGIKTKEDIDMLKGVGINAVLIGQTFMQSGNLSETLRGMGIEG